MTVARHTALNATATLVATGGRLAITTLMARRLGPDAFGWLVFTQWCAETIATVATFGLPNVLVRYCPELADAATAPRRARIRRLALAAALAVAVAIVGAGLVFSVFGRGHGPGAIFLSVAWSVAALMLMLTNSLGGGLLRFDLVLASNTAFVAVGLPAVLVLTHSGDPTGAMLVWVLASLAAAAVMSGGLWLTRRPVGEGEGRISSSRELRGYGLNTWIGGLAASQLWTRGEVGALRAFVPMPDIARYGVATTLSGLVMQGVNLFQGGLTPHLAKAWARNDKTHVEQLVRGLSGVTFAASIGGALVVLLFAPEIVGRFFGARFAAAAPALAIISFGATSAGAGSVNMVVQFATEGRFQRNANLIGAALLIGLAAALAPAFGIAGAAVARTLVVGGTGVTLMWMLHKIGYQRLSRALLWRWAAGLAMLGAVAAIEWLGHPGLFVRFALFCLGAGATIALFAERRWLTAAAEVLGPGLRWARSTVRPGARLGEWRQS